MGWPRVDDCRLGEPIRPHPRLAPGQTPPTVPLVVSGDTAKLATTIVLSADDPHGKKHMQMY